MLNQSEAVYGFAAWLTTRKEEIRFGASNDCAPIAALVKEFCEVNGFPVVTRNWPEGLIHPPGPGEVDPSLQCR